MDLLLQLQEVTSSKIVQAERNYRKDSEDRKTKSYLEKRIANLKALYNEFVENDDKILRMVPPLGENHAYLTTRKNTTDVYNKLVEEMRHRLHSGPPLTPTTSQETLQLPSSLPEASYKPTPSIRVDAVQNLTTNSQKEENNPSNSAANQQQQASTSSSIEALQAAKIEGNNNTKLFKRQDVLMRQIYQKLASINYSLETNNISKEYVSLKIRQLEKDMEEIAAQHTELLVELEEDEQTSNYFREDYYGTLQERVEDAIVKLQQFHSQTTTTAESAAQVKLPKVELPIFYGDYDRWETFNDIFTELIHQNNKLSDTVKMTYLKSHLQKGAAQIINHLTTTGDNYQTAWNIIQARYNNVRLLANHQFNALLSLATIQIPSAQAVRNLHDTAREILHNIKRLNMESPFEAFVGFILNKKLDPESIRIFETTIERPREIPQLEALFQFLERRFQSLEAMGNHRATATRPHMQYIPPLKRVNTAMLTKTCWVEGCKEHHGLNQCQQFKEMSTLSRARLVSSANLCVRCLSQHQGRKCQAETCIVCKGGHHTLLQCNNSASKTEVAAKTLVVRQHSPTSSPTAVANQKDIVLLPTAVVRVATGTGQLITMRILIDSGSQATLISSKAANLLNIKKKKTHVNISGIGGNGAGICRHTINIRIVPRFDGDFSLDIEALIFNKLTQQLPEADIDTSAWTHLSNISLADPSYNQSQPIDIILGADYYPQIIANSIIKGNLREPMAQNTEFGWIIIGSMSNAGNQLRTTMMTTKSIEEQLKLFVEIDNIPEERSCTEEEKQVEEAFQTTLKRHADGRFIVKIPFKDNHVKLGESRKRAAARLLQIEKRFAKDSEYKTLYHQFMQEYIDLNHMEPTQEKPGDVLEEAIYYIPHHGVVKPDSTTTKLRVVFDASSKTTSGVSLNDIMMNGPKLQEDLADILLRWRKHQIVMTADIEKMFRQVWLNTEDQNYHRILWRTDPSEPMKAYKLKTITYGTTAANYLAVRTLNQLAREGSETHPIAAKIMMTDFYVDDLLTGVDSIQDALLALQQLQELTAQGGFHLRKWASNSPKLLEYISSEQQANGPIQIKLNECIKTLGILYNPTDDVFEFNVSGLQLDNNQPTKRSFLSDSSKLFDPIGWLSPITIMAKIMMQDIWRTGISWDDHLPEKLNTKWQNYKDDLHEISNIKIPRWVNITLRCKMELHGFADASEYAYAAVVYCRTVDDNDEITTHLLMSKTRVAPVKTKISIPRLELNAALLLAKLMKHIQDTMKFGDVNTYAWTDSTITLCWIKGEPSRFRTFVANRISAIRSILPTTIWLHVKSNENPADIASRGTTPLLLANSKLWWKGPEFLQYDLLLDTNTLMPYSIIDVEQPDELEEKAMVNLVGIKETNTFLQLFERCSSFNKLKRIVAYCRRFINHKTLMTTNTGVPSSREVQDAEYTILKIVQEQDFYNEIVCLKSSKQLSKKSRLASLTPFIDDKGILRVKGRLQNSELALASINPIILDKHNVITARIIENAHHNTLHGGTQLTLAYLRNKFWIIDGKRAVRNIIQKCLKCFRHKQHMAEQLMGTLPVARVQPGRAFARTGLDYAGPIQLKTTKGRGHKSYKGYIALFVCMVTKAIHIEIVSSLTTEGFIAAYQRFVSRRGLCTDIYSDNGTYFVGANAVLKRNHHTALRTLPSDIADTLAIDGTNWHFIPPHTPHFGGIWEAGIKSVKFHLKRVIGESTLTFEELYTVTTQIEACLNSRPLTPLSNDVSDLTALTPGHFLIGDSLKAPPCAHIESTGLKTRWHMTEQMVQHIWRRWSAEYIHQLQQRTKWTTTRPNLMINDLVLLKDDQLPATRWKLGRVLETHAGKDHLVRVATVKCQDGTYKRPIIKLCKLPIENELDETLPSHNKSSEGSSTTTNNLTLRQQPFRQAKAVGRTSLVTLALLSLCCIMGIAQANIQLNPFNQSTGIYFEELGKLEIVATKWTLVIHYNLTTYLEEIENFKIGHTKIQAVCMELPGLNCDVILEQLLWQYDNLIADNELLFEGNKERKRVRRGVGDSVGLVLGDMFGILTQREAEQYESHFERISNNENHILALIKNQTTIVDNTIKLVKHNTNLTTTSINNMIKDQQWLRQEIGELRGHTIYEDRVRAALISMFEITLTLRSLEDTQQGLLDVLYHAQQDFLHPSILTPTELEEELQLIRQNMPVTITVPGHNIHDLHHVYQSMNIRSRVTQRNIIIEIILPLSFAWDYTLLSVVPIPDIIHGSTLSQIISSTDYLAMDSRREHFALLTKEDVNRCRMFQPVQFLCEIPTITTTSIKPTKCEVAILQRKNGLNNICSTKTIKASNHWIKLHAANQWIYVIPNETTVDVICSSRNQPYTISGSGIIEIQPGCIIRDSEVQIIAVGTSQHNIDKSFQNSTHLLHGAHNLREFSTYVKNKTKGNADLNLLTTLETTDLENQIETLKDDGFKFHHQNVHHIHHYAMIHLVFWSCLLIGIIWLIHKLRGKYRINQRPPSPLARPEESSV